MVTLYINFHCVCVELVNIEIFYYHIEGVCILIIYHMRSNSLVNSKQMYYLSLKLEKKK